MCVLSMFLQAYRTVTVLHKNKKMSLILCRIINSFVNNGSEILDFLNSNILAFRGKLDKRMRTANQQKLHQSDFKRFVCFFLCFSFQGTTLESPEKGISGRLWILKDASILPCWPDDPDQCPPCWSTPLFSLRTRETPTLVSARSTTNASESWIHSRIFL